MKERSIIFKAEEVRAILAGRKTQTRRIVKRHRCSPHLVFLDYGKGWWPFESNDGESSVMGDGCEYPLACPYGRPGDVLWVREAFIHEPADYCWEASVSTPCRPAHTEYRADYPESESSKGWRPSIHMPRSLSRITLEVTGVHVERLQDISEADAAAEGATGVCPVGNLNAYNEGPLSYHFAQMWDAINKSDQWVENPWVWVINFKRISK